MQDRSWFIPSATAYDIVAIACSAGGLRALRVLLAGLPASFSAPVLVALHRGDTASEYLVRILQGCTRLKVREARDGDRPQPGAVYVAPGGRHLELTSAGGLSVGRCGRIRFVCPSADLLFNTIAACHGGRAIAMVLTGHGDDGAVGATAVRRAGGFVVAQDPRSCEHPGMAHSAIETRKVDLILPLDQLAHALQVLTMEEASAA